MDVARGDGGWRGFFVSAFVSRNRLAGAPAVLAHTLDSFYSVDRELSNVCVPLARVLDAFPRFDTPVSTWTPSTSSRMSPEVWRAV